MCVMEERQRQKHELIELNTLQTRNLRHEIVITPRRVCASRVKQSVLSVCHRLSYKKIFQTGDLEAITIAKQEVTIEIPKNCRVCTCNDQNDFYISSSFLFNSSKVRHFNTVS